MANLLQFKRHQVVGARMAGARIPTTADLFGVVRITVSKIMTAFEKERKTSLKKNREERENSPIGIVGLLRRLLGRIIKIQLQKLQQSLIIITRTQFP